MEVEKKTLSDLADMPTAEAIDQLIDRVPSKYDKNTKDEILAMIEQRKDEIQALKIAPRQEFNHDQIRAMRFLICDACGQRLVDDNQLNCSACVPVREIVLSDHYLRKYPMKSKSARKAKPLEPVSEE